jgi:hypothetical protein
MDLNSLMIVQVEANVVAANHLIRDMEHRVVFDRLIEALGGARLDNNLEVVLDPWALDALTYSAKIS